MADAGVTVTGIGINVSGAQDLAGNIQIASAATGSFSIDTQNPVVGNISSTAADGWYKSGASIPITITFSEAVNLAGGAPTLTLNTGGVATYLGGSGGTILSFDCIVSDGQSAAHLDYASISALLLNGGAIADLAGNAATLTLPAPGSPGSLGASKNIGINAVMPTLTWGTSTPAANAAGWNNTDVSLPFTAADATSGLASPVPASPLVLSAEGSNVKGTVTLTDVAGNVAVFTSPAFKIDKTPPTVSIDPVTTPTSGAVDQATIVFSEAVSLSLSSLKLTREGVNIPLVAGAQTLTSADGITWVLGGLATLTDKVGSYAVSVLAGPAVTDIAGNALAAGAGDAWLMDAVNATAATNGIHIVRSGGLLDIAVNGDPVYAVDLSSLGQLLVNGTAGDDTLTVDASGGDPVPAGGLAFHGGPGNNSVVFTGTMATDSVTAGPTQTLLDGSAITYAAQDSVGLLAGADHGVTLGSLTIEDVATLGCIGGGNVLATESLSIAATGTLDLRGNGLIVHAGNFSQINSWITQGHGTTWPFWHGTGITSSDAWVNEFAGIGTLLNNDGADNAIRADLMGHAAVLNDVLARFTWNGDADLSGTVNADDYFQIDRGYRLVGQDWIDGNFDYMGGTTVDDYYYIDQAFIHQNQPLYPTVAGAATGASSAPSLVEQTLRRVFD